MRSALRTVGVQRAKTAEKTQERGLVHGAPRVYPIVCVICRAASQLTERLEDGWSD